MKGRKNEREEKYNNKIGGRVKMRRWPKEMKTRKGVAMKEKECEKAMKINSSCS